MVWDSISRTLPTAKKTVNRVLKRAKKFDISWLLDENDTDAVLEEEFFPSVNQVTSNKRMLDSAYIHKELLRNEVSKKLLWTEYMEDCRANGEEPLMYSQFCYHIQQNEQKRRATMHINRKPGERYKRHQTSLRKKQVRFSPVIPSGDLALSFGVLLSWFQQKDFFWSRFSKALMIEDLLPEGQESVLWCLN